MGRAAANSSVLYVDLDGFKLVNDNHGHAAGDEILQRVAACLREVVGPEEVVARIGGDEFVVLLADADALTARVVADEIIAAISREHRIFDGRVLRVGCSVGISMAPDQGREPEVLAPCRRRALCGEEPGQGPDRRMARAERDLIPPALLQVSAFRTRTAGRRTHRAR